MDESTCRNEVILWNERNCYTKSSIFRAHSILLTCSRPTGDKKQKISTNEYSLVKESALETHSMSELESLKADPVRKLAVAVG
jgi:hypothetical protein